MSVKSMVSIPSDQTANLAENMYQDLNGDYGGLVKVMLAASNATFEGLVLKTQVHSASEYWVFMAKGSDRLKVTVPGYLPLKVDFRDYKDCIIQSRHTYVLTITLPQSGVSVSADDGMRYLAMTVEPKNSMVLVDGESHAVDSNGELSVLLLKGTHRYQVSAVGYATKEGTVEVGDVNDVLAVRLVSTQATLRVECATAGAQVFVNNQQLGIVPWSGSLASGSYEVEARLDGYRSKKQMVTLGKGENRTVTLPELQLISGILNVNYRPLGSDVYVDGVRVGTSPNIFRNVRVGDRRVEVRKEGYEPVVSTVTVRENEQTSFSGTLNAAASGRSSDTANAAHSSESTSSPVASSSDLVSYLTCPDGNHPHLIDLGLPSGTKWSCCNVGANKPEDYGGYYAWGETETKTQYDWSTYRHCEGTEESCRNIGDEIAGTQYDVAHVKWGGSWVMPSNDQVKELLDNCKMKWTKVNGVKGRKFTSKKNGGSVFLPAAGYRWDDGLRGAGSNGYYWSSTQGPSGTSGAYRLYVRSDEADWYYYDRSRGHTVRPVSR